MLIVGELINASRKMVGKAIQEENEAIIRDLALAQHESGAHLIDVNAGLSAENETEYLAWLVKIVQEATDSCCCIDSPNPAALEAALQVHKGNAMINSISLEKERFENVIPLLAGTDLRVIALCMSDEGMPETTDQRLDIADALINKLIQNNIAIENIYVDPLVQPVSTNSQYGVAFLDTVDQIMLNFKGCHTICGLTNISFGLPERKLLNRTFLSMAVSKGLDAVIIDPLDRQIRQTLFAATALSGHDDFCVEYIKAFRSKKLS